MSKVLPAAAADRVDAATIAEAMGVSDRAVRMRAATAGWPYTEVAQRGGYRRLYSVAALPQDVREALADAVVRAFNGDPVDAAPAAVLALRPSRALVVHDEAAQAAMTSAQRGRELARRQAVGFMRNLQMTLGCSDKGAADEIHRLNRLGALPAVMAAVFCRAADERGRAGGASAGLPSVVTLRRWMRDEAAGRSLAPRPSAQVDLAVRGWYRPFFALTDRPQKPTLKSAHEQLLAAWQPEWADAPGAPPPSYDAVVRAYNKRSRIDQLKGRHTGSALRSKMFFHKRTYAGMPPGTEVHADGWTTHFTAPDPKTGAYVTYEVWHFHCVATRYVTPLAVGLTENTDVILLGLERCIRVLGVPCIWQTDHTSSVKNARVKSLDDDHAGLDERLGLTVVHPQTVGNSQANGIAENFNTWLDREARELATYQHPDRMDSGTFVRVRRITNAMVKAADRPAERAQLRAQAMKLGKGIVFDSHAEALAWLDSKTAKWNAHPHRELPKLRDEATGRMVHMSPQQSLDAARAAGWQPVAMTEAELVEEFRPHLRKKVTRGTVTPFGGMRYHHVDLAHHEGEEVLVAVDRDDPAHVRVKDLQGRLIVQAAFVAAVGPRTESMAEHTDRKRAEAQIRRREQQIDQIAERMAPAAIEAAPSPALDMPLPPLRAQPAHPREPEPLLPPLRPAAPAPEPGRLSLMETYERLQALEEAAKAARAARAAAEAQDLGGSQEEGGVTPEKKVARG